MQCAFPSDAAGAGTVDDTVVVERTDAFAFPRRERTRLHALSEDRPTRVLRVFSPALPIDGTRRIVKERDHE